MTNTEFVIKNPDKLYGFIKVDEDEYEIKWQVETSSDYQYHITPNSVNGLVPQNLYVLTIYKEYADNELGLVGLNRVCKIVLHRGIHKIQHMIGFVDLSNLTMFKQIVTGMIVGLETRIEQNTNPFPPLGQWKGQANTITSSNGIW